MSPGTKEGWGRRERRAFQTCSHRYCGAMEGCQAVEAADQMMRAATGVGDGEERVGVGCITRFPFPETRHTISSCLIKPSLPSLILKLLFILQCPVQILSSVNCPPPYPCKCHQIYGSFLLWALGLKPHECRDIVLFTVLSRASRPGPVD